MSLPIVETAQDTIIERLPPEWSDDLKKEFACNRLNGCVGNILLSESDRARIWKLKLNPGERVPVHCHVLDYFWIAETAGRVRSHFSDGRVSDKSYQEGDIRHFKFGLGDYILHDLKNTGDSNLVFTVVEFLDSANSPLKIDV